MTECFHSPIQRDQAVLGCLLGTAVGDALGLPYEGLSRRRIAKLGTARHRLVLGRGMLSDDTEQSLMLAAALCRHPDDLDEMQRDLGRQLQWWLLALPAGVGLSTAKAIARLWLGIPARKSGVRSAGNGAAMRSVIVGVICSEDATQRRDVAIAACQVTHTDPRAEESAVLVAEAAACSVHGLSNGEAIGRLERHVVSDETKSRWQRLKSGLKTEQSVMDFAVEIGCGTGVSGFAPNTVAVALYAWLRHRRDFATTVRSVIECGGDTDTVASIAGGISGAEVGEEGIPQEWIEGICDWPRSVSHIRKVAFAVAKSSRKVPHAPWPFVVLRNAFFLAVVLLHGLRRTLPPY